MARSPDRGNCAPATGITAVVTNEDNDLDG
jgi:hypothetical protein